MKERNFIFSSKTFRRTCFKKGFYVSIGTFWRKEILINLHFFNSFELWAKKRWPFLKTYWRNYQNCNLRNRRTILRKKFFEKTVVFSQFLTLSKNFWPFVKVSGWGFQKCNLCVCIRTFLGEIEFWKDLHFCLYGFGHRDNFLAFHLKSLKAVVKTAFCLSFTTIWAYKKIFKKKWRANKNLSILEHWSKKFRLFIENISTGLSKLHPTSAFETFWGGTFFWKKLSVW